MLRRLSDWEYNYPEGIDILAVVWMNRPCHLRRKGVEPKCEADALCHWERAPRGRGRCVASTPAGAPTS